MSTFTIPSLTDPNKRYEVSLVGNGSCTCKDWQCRRAETGEPCKHIRQARAEQFAKYALIAGTLEDAELERLIAKYRPQPGPVLLSLLAEQHDRWLLEAQPAPLLVFAPLERVLVRARAWGQARQPVGKQSGLTEEQRKAVWA